MIKCLYLFSIVILLSNMIFGQVTPSTGQEIMESFVKRQELADSSIFKGYPVRSIGPVVQGGRVSDLAVNLSNSKEYYVAYASGGVFRTSDNGITFQPIFDEQGALGVGDMALAASDENIIYVGTGEKNSSRSSYAGSGIYKSIDKGNSWEFMGLPDIHHTSRVIVHPQNPDIVWVASAGALYSHNANRGIFKSVDGGRSWQKTLYVNDSTGIIDLLINPGDPDQLWAASWERTRKAWDFKGHGPGSGIYRSDDGGMTWYRLVNGFPDHDFVGRIGLDLCLEQPNVLYALLDNQQESKAPKEIKPGEIQPKDLLEMSLEAFAKIDSAHLNKYLRDHGFPEKYHSQRVKEAISQGLYTPKALVDYLGDANRALFETKVIGAELYRSDDYGDTWKKVNSYPLDGVYFTYGYYFGEVRVAPDDPDIAYIFGVPLLTTGDGGNTFHRLDTVGNVHVDHQALWINPEDSKHLILGNDGGLYVSHDQGGHWVHINNTAVGQFYTVNVDLEKPYNVYGGLQDNGVLMGSSRSIPNKTEKWEKVFGGDGMFVSADPRNSDLIYTGFQFGNYFRIRKSNGQRKQITPKHDIGDQALRFNWRTPVVLSEHNADIIYFGAQRLFRSLDKGDSWESISDDLTTNRPQGNVPFSTITCISESPLKFGLIYVGTDDGNIQVTRSGGGDWTLVSEKLPSRWVSSLFPSPHKEDQVYVSLNGYRDDEFKTYIYFSDDYGQVWQSLKGNLPEVVVNVIRQDPVNQDLLYLGTDHGAYASFDHGETWHLVTGIPNVAVYDLIVHPRENELVVATHGRSMYVLDVSPWQQLAENGHLKAVVPFSIADMKHSEEWGKSQYPWSKPNDPQKTFLYYVGVGSDQVKIAVSDEKDNILYEQVGPGSIGFHQIKWDLKQLPKKNKKGTATYVGPGVYKVVFSNAGVSASVNFSITAKKP